jgi:Uma2 family endonuclease
MSANPTVTLMSTEELLALPEDGVERELIRGELREKPMTIRNRTHSRIEARVAQLLYNWLDAQPEPRGEVLCGEVGCRLRRSPDTTVGIDVVYIDAATAARRPAETTLVDGPPVLAVEILSPSDRQEEIDETVQEYLASGVRAIWIINPVFRTVTVFRPDAPPTMANVNGELTAEPHLPGFRAAVADLFRS